MNGSMANNSYQAHNRRYMDHRQYKLKSVMTRKGVAKFSEKPTESNDRAELAASG